MTDISKTQSKKNNTATNTTVVLENMGRTWKATAETIYEALSDLGLSWEQIKGRGIITVKRGELEHQHLFNGSVLRRIFSNKITRQLWAKNLEYLLKSDNKTNLK